MINNVHRLSTLRTSATAQPRLSSVYRRLAARVFEQALLDLADDDPDIQRSARRWLTEPSEGLRFWSDVIGFDARAVVERTREQLNVPLKAA